MRTVPGWRSGYRAGLEILKRKGACNKRTSKPVGLWLAGVRVPSPAPFVSVSFVKKHPTRKMLTILLSSPLLSFVFLFLVLSRFSSVYCSGSLLLLFWLLFLFGKILPLQSMARFCQSLSIRYTSSFTVLR